MKKTIEQIIKNLTEFIPHEYDNSAELDEVLEGLADAENSSIIIPFMFELMENFPDSDLGSPGILVHFIEDAGNYEECLIKSVEKVPMYLNVWMVNRILNTFLTQERRNQYLDLLESISRNPKATNYGNESAKDFLNYQRNRQL